MEEDKRETQDVSSNVKSIDQDSGDSSQTVGMSSGLEMGPELSESGTFEADCDSEKLVKLLDATDAYMAARAQLHDVLKAGFFALAQARYSSMPVRFLLAALVLSHNSLRALIWFSPCRPIDIVFSFQTPFQSPLRRFALAASSERYCFIIDRVVSLSWWPILVTISVLSVIALLPQSDLLMMMLLTIPSSQHWMFKARPFNEMHKSQMLSLCSPCLHTALFYLM